MSTIVSGTDYQNHAHQLAPIFKCAAVLRAAPAIVKYFRKRATEPIEVEVDDLEAWAAHVSSARDLWREIKHTVGEACSENMKLTHWAKDIGPQALKTCGLRITVIGKDVVQKAYKESVICWAHLFSVSLVFSFTGTARILFSQSKIELSRLS